MISRSGRDRAVSIWRNRQFWSIVMQVVAVVAVLVAIAFLWFNLTANLQRKGIQLGFEFLKSQASFDIAETPIPYQASDPYFRALLVGLTNSFKVMGMGIVLATIVGASVGIARLSDNWLVRNLALVYVEIFRNTPLLLQLFFWYFVLFVPQIVNEGENTTESLFSPEFLALLTGLTVYTAAFIAEIVRGGIQAVPKGQWEAAKSLGLKSGSVLRLVIFPQAWRTIIPPLTSQYLNLAKNSSLAVAIAYPDFYSVASTTFNQTGRAIEIVLIIAIAYLAISLVISLFMNFLNRSVQIPER
jgi:general L-amino acid transport system permease protein